MDTLSLYSSVPVSLLRAGVKFFDDDKHDEARFEELGCRMPWKLDVKMGTS